MRVSLAGGVEFRGEDGLVGGSGLGAPARVAAAYLVVERLRPVSRDELADVIWAGELPQSWKQLVRGVVAQVRVALRETGLPPQEALTTAFSCYQLQLPSAVVDIERAADDLAASVTAQVRGDFERARVTAAASARVASRGFLPGAEGPWVEAQQSSLREVHLRSLEALAVACRGLGDERAAIDAAETILSIEPYRESVYAVLMRAQGASGNPAEALRTFERCRQQLREHLGVDPSPSTEAVYLEMLGAERTPVVTTPMARHDVQLPAAVAAVRRTAFVGRDQELATILAAVAEGQPSPAAAFVGGEPGIGKTRLVFEAALSLAEGGARVVHGACVENATAFEPFGAMAQELRSFTSAVHSREELMERLVDTFVDESSRQPLVVVVDDLQWASVPAVLLLRRLLRTSTYHRFVILGTFRRDSAEQSDHLTELLGDVARSASMERVDIGGLDVTALTDFIRRDGADDVRRRAVVLADELHDATHGNPFFARELIRQWNAGASSIPPAVVDVVRAELVRVPPEARHVLTIAAVVGLEFDLWALRTLTELDDEAIVDALEHACRAGLAVESSDVSDRWSFTHALVRDALAAEISSARRARVHTSFGLALAARHDSGAAGAVAAHLLAGTPDHHADAIPWLVAAAERDATDFAYESSVATYERALALLGAQPTSASDEDALRVRLGHATALGRAGMRKQSHAALHEVATRARACAEWDTLATAAIAIASRSTPRGSGRPSPTAAALLEEALRQLPQEPHRLRAQVVTYLAIERYLAGDAAAGLALVEEARALAQQLDDPLVDLGVAAAMAGEGIDPLENERRARAWLYASLRTGELDHELWARINLVWSTVGSARLSDAWDEAAAFERRARDLRRSASLWWVTVWEASRATIEGRLGDASAYLDEASATGTELEGPNAGVQLWLLRVALERLSGGVRDATVAEFDDAYGGPASTVLRPIAGFIRWHGGQQTQIAAEIRDGTWSTAIDEREGNHLPYTSLMAEMAAGAGANNAVLDDFDARLRPYSGRLVVAGFCGAVFGSVDRVLALLAAARGQAERADSYFDTAERVFLVNNATAWIDVIRAERARLG